MDKCKTYHSLEFIGDGIWKCTICGKKQTNNISLVDHEKYKKEFFKAVDKTNPITPCKKNRQSL